MAVFNGGFRKVLIRWIELNIIHIDGRFIGVYSKANFIRLKYIGPKTNLVFRIIKERT
jgi:hypothetical protein